MNEMTEPKKVEFEFEAKCAHCGNVLYFERQTETKETSDVDAVGDPSVLICGCKE